MAENTRTTSARDHDDHELIDDASELPTPGQSSASGGHLAQDVATQAEQMAVADPDSHLAPEKEDAMNNDQAHRSARSGGATG